MTARVAIGAKKLFKRMLIGSALLLAAIVILKVLVYPPFGGVSIAAASVLGGFSLLSLGSLLGYDRKRDLINRVWLLLVSIVVTYVVFDLAAGLVLIKRLSPPTVPDSVVHHRLEPSTSSRFESTEFDYVQHVNSHGLRGPELAPKGDAYRILILGDSFTMGKGVADDYTYSAQLQRLIEKQPGRRVQIINAGVDSYAPVLSYLLLKSLLPKLNPDLVIESFDMSDLLQEVAYRSTARFGSDGEVLAVDGRNDTSVSVALPHAFRGWVHDHLFLTRLAVFQLTDRTAISVDNVVSFADPRLLKHTLESDTEDRADQWKSVFDSLRRMKALCDRHGADLLLTTYPWGHQVRDNEWTTGRASFVPAGAKVSDRSVRGLERFAREHDIDFLDLFPTFREPSSKPLYYALDMHWTVTGHARMAEALHRKLATQR